jgi:5-methyltetrahydrofolate--homocysteine methyltransferase
MPPNLKVTLNICRGMSIQLRCREKRIAVEDSLHIRDLFHQKYRGSRYSFGYPACPNLEDQTKLFALLKPEENVGVRLTSGFLLEPEQSTSAIVVHHPGAKYFVV